MTDAGATEVAYVILTGGRSSRLGTDKAKAQVNKVALLDRLLDSFPKAPIVIGPEVQGGPAAAINAALGVIMSPWVAVVAVDMPFAPPVIAYLAQLTDGAKADGFIPIDATGKEQWLCGIYRTGALRAAMTVFGSVVDAPLHQVLGSLNFQRVQLPDELAKLLIDIDTPADLQRAEFLDQEAQSYWTK